MVLALVEVEDQDAAHQTVGCERHGGIQGEICASFAVQAGGFGQDRLTNINLIVAVAIQDQLQPRDIAELKCAAGQLHALAIKRHRFIVAVLHHKPGNGDGLAAGADLLIHHRAAVVVRGIRRRPWGRGGLSGGRRTG